MVPHQAVMLEAFPLSANGKVDMQALQAFNRGRQEQRKSIPPRDAIEESILEVWQEALGRSGFGVEDNLFELGADSVHAVGIVGRVKSELALLDASQEELLQLLFENPTVAGFATATKCLRDTSGSALGE
jgi:hypothetical protein